MVTSPVRQLRVVLNTDDLPAAVAFYRDALGLPEEAAFSGPDGAHVVILDAGRATLELADAAQSAFIASVETGGAASTPVRLAFEVDDAAAATATLADAGAHVVAAPVRTPWSSLNARVLGPEGLHVTLFQELADPAPVVPGDPVPEGGEPALLALAVDLAVRNVAAGGQPFAALAVRDGVVLAVGVNTVDAAYDPTAHAEVEVVRDAARRAGSADLRGAVVYSSCEPCPVCRVVAAAAGATVVFAAGKDAVPADLAGDDAGLRDAVDRARPDLVRRGAAAVDVTAPFTAWAGR